MTPAGPTFLIIDLADDGRLTPNYIRYRKFHSKYFIRNILWEVFQNLLVYFFEKYD